MFFCPITHILSLPSIQTGLAVRRVPSHHDLLSSVSEDSMSIHSSKEIHSNNPKPVAAAIASGAKQALAGVPGGKPHPLSQMSAGSSPPERRAPRRAVPSLPSGQAGRRQMVWLVGWESISPTANGWISWCCCLSRSAFGDFIVVCTTLSIG
ncbi:uncharacterized protein BKA78DRAFT_96591 [Phyllosticta capitalensis]|uniref:uncharacterized protein n=1 Tax=Phyllosticta capitalensis TaxID=121624 RepID=UPI00313219FB